MKLAPLLASLLIGATCAHAQFNILRTFYGTDRVNGESPAGTVVADGNGQLYGTTFYGGSNDAGVVYSISTNGADYTILAEFPTNTASVASEAPLLLLDGTLYGVVPTSEALFAIETNGANYRVLHTFTGAIGGERYPDGALLHTNGTLIGVSHGPTGTVYSIGTDGNGFQIIHQFFNNLGAGRTPTGGILMQGATLYGLTYYTGTPTLGSGTVYSVEMNGSNFQILRTFDVDTTLGAFPVGRLITDGTKLYGTTHTAGTNSVGTATRGVVFSMDFNGGNYRVLNSFTGSLTEGYFPNGDLLLVGGNLIGTTQAGGNDSAGTIFQVSTNGTGFQTLSYMNFNAGGGAVPYGGLVQLGDTFYGASKSGIGGAAPNAYLGSVFSFTPTNSVAPPVTFTCALTPALTTNDVGTTHTVVATVTSNAVARSGALVNFTVTGANAGESGTATTSVSGTASFTYTGTFAGSDTIRGISLGATGTATKVWITPQLPDLAVELVMNFSACSNTTKKLLCPIDGSLALLNNGNAYGQATLAVTNSCKPGAIPPSCKLKGKLSVPSLDLGSLPAHALAFYLSTDSAFDPATDFRMAELKLSKLVAAFIKGKTVKFSLKLPKGVDFTGQHILAVVDNNGAIAETDENNNTSATGPIPSPM